MSVGYLHLFNLITFLFVSTIASIVMSFQTDLDLLHLHRLFSVGLLEGKCFCLLCFLV